MAELYALLYMIVRHARMAFSSHVSPKKFHVPRELVRASIPTKADGVEPGDARL
jgi:hypothetical protein